MFISELKLKNFRCYLGNTKLNFSQGINYLVGDNNAGKTTIFKAVDFLVSAKSKDGWISESVPNNEVSVEIVLRGDDLFELLEKDDLKKFRSYLAENNNSYELRLKKSSKPSQWKPPRGKEKEITIKNISLYNPKKRQYENPTGADSFISELLEPLFVYSDLNHEEYQDFGKTKIVGKLINEITGSFKQSNAWNELENAHKTAFGEENFAKELNELESKLERCMNEQYGAVKVQFKFELPAVEYFFKTGHILLEDNGIKTDVSEKGTGMQRALAISLIQVYAQIVNEKTSLDKSLFFFLDEPETFLHPKAQDRLLNALEKISLHSQIFITTHSPYLLKNYSNNNTVKVFSRENGEVQRITNKKLDLFPFSPTWGEINYQAFGVVSVEFHIELFDFLNFKVKELFGIKDSISAFDEWLALQDIVKITFTDSNHINNHDGKIDKTMTVYIRNCIDHPRKQDHFIQNRPEPTKPEIEKSIQEMLELMDKLKNKSEVRRYKAIMEEAALPTLSIKECNDLSMPAVLSFKADTTEFNEKVLNLDTQVKRADINDICPENCFLLYIDKPSEMKQFTENHFILVQKTAQPHKKKMVVFIYKNEIAIRQYTKKKNIICLVSSISKEKNIICSPEEIQFLGEIIEDENKKYHIWKKE